MARAPRNFVPGEIYHVFSRGSNKQPIFRYDSDRIDFLGCFERVVTRCGLVCLAYALLTNHFHVVVQTTDGQLSAAMKALNGRYALRYNRRHAYDAHLFKNRFGAIHQDSEMRLLSTLRYVIRNPLEAGLCTRLEDWPWSSYAASVGDVPPPRFLALWRLLSYFGDSPSMAMFQFREFVQQGGRADGV